ncbi:Zinc finger, C3HC4 type (RING finger) family protein [Cryptosporidium meleagridis]|uniref:Zinc finger, C3HC4 type (RING finger) family protein n=1 Tax=Cryptosporidium meleagridis TaxID=93969 RepID=A0A2P4Z592_9CRYT|nr:Zinc finger, C3HC4 type (RING finger) family protein [Cryptosporidium meleagridis]
MSLISKKGPLSISSKFKFVQQNCRIFLLKDFNLNRNTSVLSYDKITFDWRNVGLIELIYFDSDEFIKCPICLDSDLLVPKISNCGHIYCWPCIIKLMNIILEKDEYAKKFKCPICFSNVLLNELVSLRYQIVKKVQIGSEINLCLLYRNISSPLIHFELNMKNSDGKVLLERNEKGAQFQRIGLISDQNEILLHDLQMLRMRKLESEKSGLNEEICYIEECISIIENILKLKGVTPSCEIFSNDAFDMLLSHYGETELLEELEYRFINSSANCSNQCNMKDIFYFYQLFDGQLVFLEPFYVKVLQTEFGSIENLPKALLNVSITSIKEFIISHQNIRKYKFLSHIPMGSKIYIVGINVLPYISTKTKETFNVELEKRVNKGKTIKDMNYMNLLYDEINHSSTDYELINLNHANSCSNINESNKSSMKATDLDFPTLEKYSNLIGKDKIGNASFNKGNAPKILNYKSNKDFHSPLARNI